jgi:hypothetical protein
MQERQLDQVGRRYAELRDLLHGVEERVELHSQLEVRAHAAADGAIAEERDRAIGELRSAERAARAANAESSVLRAVAEGVEAEVERYRLEEEATVRTLYVMNLEVSGARSDLELLWSREQRVELEARAELQACLSAELQFVNETRSHREECQRMLRQAQEKSDLDRAVQGERVKALEVEVERKSRTPVWNSAVWSGWRGWGAQWEKGEKWACAATSYWMAASAEGYADAVCRGLGVAPASERPLKTATSLLEPVRVEVAEDWFGQRTPPGLATWSALHGASADVGDGRLL